MDVETDLSPQKKNIQFKFHSVSPDYFRTMQIPLLAGREFQAQDRASARAVGILNQAMVDRLFGGVNPLGHTVRFEGNTVEIVGVVPNAKHFMLTENNEPAFYEPYDRMNGRTDLHFLIRPSGRPEPLLPAINAALGQVDATAAIETKPMYRALTFALLPSRFGAAVLGSMGFLGLLLAAIGLYGVLLYSVSRRTREIGLRVALGATPRSISEDGDGAERDAADYRPRDRHRAGCVRRTASGNVSDSRSAAIGPTELRGRRSGPLPRRHCRVGGAGDPGITRRSDGRSPSRVGSSTGQPVIDPPSGVASSLQVAASAFQELARGLAELGALVAAGPAELPHLATEFVA